MLGVGVEQGTDEVLEVRPQRSMGLSDGWTVMAGVPQPLFLRRSLSSSQSSGGDVL